MTTPSRKREVLHKVFEYVAKNKPSDVLVFDNDLVKGISGTSFSNQFDVTKCDTSAKLPQIMKDNDYFVVHLGEGKHQFVKGIDIGFHKLEPIPDTDEMPWPYRKSLLNETDTSEASILALVENQRVIHDFLYEDIIASPKRYLPRRTKASFTYHIGTQTIVATNLVIEIDMVLEYQGAVAVCEGKNGQPIDMAVYQLYHPYRYFCGLRDQQKLDVKNITCLFVNRYTEANSSVVEFRQYRFKKENEPASIELHKAARYRLVRR